MRANVASLCAGCAALLFPLHVFAAESAPNGPVTVQTLGQWVTPITFPGDLQVAHVRVRISARSPVDIAASDFVGTLHADGGGTRTLAALDWPAPSYENDGLIGVTGTRPDVDPPEDLGALGRLHIEPAASVVGTLTFELPLQANARTPISTVIYRVAGAVKPTTDDSL